MAPVRKLDARETLLLGLFLDSFAGDTTTDLYRVFINGSTRKLDLGAEGVFGYLSQDQGDPVVIGLDRRRRVQSQRSEGREKFVRSSWLNWRVSRPCPTDRRNCEDFNALVRGRVVDQRRQLSKLVNSPPGFGARDTGSFWMEHLYHLNREPGFRKAVTQKPDLDAIDQMLAGRTNVWRDALKRWRLIGHRTLRHRRPAEPRAAQAPAAGESGAYSGSGAAPQNEIQREG